MPNRRLTATEVLRNFCNRCPALDEYGQLRPVDRTARRMLRTTRCAEAVLGEPVGDRAGMASDLTPDLLERTTVGDPGR
jgi:hypothetical protein